MLVRDIMKTEVITVAAGATIEQARLLMLDHAIRHLPVLEEGRLVGVVTDRDVHLATSALIAAPATPGERVGDVMARPPHTADPLDPVEDAARTMRSLKIGCLPVVEADELVGIVTGIDLLDALLRLTGVQAPSARLELRLTDRPGELARLTALLAERRIAIRSILTYEEGADALRAVLRVATIETPPLAGALREAGFDVVWPPAAPWRR